MTDSISNNNELPRFNLKEFRCITENDVELQIDAIETYIRSSTQEMNKLKVALAQSQKKDAEIIAHSIKGASKYVAADKMSKLANEVETLCRDGNLSEALKRIPEIEEELTETNKVLSNFCDNAKKNGSKFS